MTNEDVQVKTISTYDRNAAAWVSSHAVDNELTWAFGRLKMLLPKGSLIEIGCGGTRDAAALIGLGYDYLGTDASKGMIAVAKRELPFAHFKQVNLFELPDAFKQMFDGFWARAVLLHVPKNQIDQALQSISAVLREGAIGLISMKDGDKEEFEVRTKHGLLEERFFAYWRQDEFTRALARNGFSVLEYRYQPSDERTQWHVFFVQKATSEHSKQSRRDVL